MDQAAIIPTTTAIVNSERRITSLLVAVCELRIEPTHSTWQRGWSQETLQCCVDSRDRPRLWTSPNLCILPALCAGGGRMRPPLHRHFGNSRGVPECLVRFSLTCALTAFY